MYTLGEDGCIRGWPSTAPQQPFVTAWQVDGQISLASLFLITVFFLRPPHHSPPAPLPHRPAPPQELVRSGLRSHQLRLLATTWNVNEMRPSRGSLTTWLKDR